MLVDRVLAVPLRIELVAVDDSSSDGTREVLQQLARARAAGVDAITVHPRTRSQQYAGRAPWEIIASVVDAVRVPVTGPGVTATSARTTSGVGVVTLTTIDGGATEGYCATGSRVTATLPSTRMNSAITQAKIGRSMKKREMFIVDSAVQ